MHHSYVNVHCFYDCELFQQHRLKNLSSLISSPLHVSTREISLILRELYIIYGIYLLLCMISFHQEIDMMIMNIMKFFDYQSHNREWPNIRGWHIYPWHFNPLFLLFPTTQIYGSNDRVIFPRSKGMVSLHRC